MFFCNFLLTFLLFLIKYYNFIKLTNYNHIFNNIIIIIIIKSFKFFKYY